ncbi:hypothetical protein ACWKWC_03220 [Geodermatophilus nigrescens]
MLSVAVAALALGTASGVTLLESGDYRTEFISGWWWLAFLMLPLPASCGRRRIWTMSLAAIALVVPQFVAAAVCVGRYRASGWNDGLEVLSFIHPVLLTLATVAICGLVAFVSHHPVQAPSG